MSINYGLSYLYREKIEKLTCYIYISHPAGSSCTPKHNHTKLANYLPQQQGQLYTCLGSNIYSYMHNIDTYNNIHPIA